MSELAEAAADRDSPDAGHEASGPDLFGPGAADTQPDSSVLPSACIHVTPDKVSFGGKKIGEQAVAPLEVSACGGVPLELYSLQIEEGSSPDFGVDTTPLEHEPTPDYPVVVPAGGTVVVNVHYIPDAENPVVEGKIVLDEGTLLIASNAAQAGTKVALSGAGVG